MIFVIIERPVAEQERQRVRAGLQQERRQAGCQPQLARQRLQSELRVAVLPPVSLLMEIIDWRRRLFVEILPAANHFSNAG